MARKKGTVYILFNELDSRYRFKAARFVLDEGYVPTYPTMVGDFFESAGGRRASRDELLRKCDELWVFGKITASMQEQANTARRLGKPVRVFQVFEGQFLEDRPERAFRA